jgi:hypothetical protein
MVLHAGAVVEALMQLADPPPEPVKHLALHEQRRGPGSP